MSSDPLTGKREAINADKLHRLVWADPGSGCPVKVGEIFDLRQCSIEITRIERKRERGQFVWTANFTRYARSSDKLWLLGPNGYVHQPRAALKAQDELATASRPDDTEPAEAHRVPHPVSGEPPEIEAIPPSEVKSLPASVKARADYEAIRSDDIARRLRRSLVEDIRQAHLSPEQLIRLAEFVDELQSERQLAA